MTWTAIWSITGEKQLRKLPKTTRNRILLKTREVEANPFQHLDKLANSYLFKYRVGSYRIMVDVVNDKLILYLLNVKKRSRAYD